MSSEARAGVVVFASGAGTNFRALCDAASSGRLPARVVALVTNAPGCGAVAIARGHGVPVFELASKGRSREEHEALICKTLGSLEFDWIVLAGYMRLFTPEFVRRYPRVVNIHPSLLPAFPGVHGYRQALEHGVKVTGATVHLLGDGLDDGPIVAQASLEIADTDDEPSLTRRGLALEHELYPRALARLLVGGWTIGRGPGGSGRARVVFPGEGRGA